MLLNAYNITKYHMPSNSDCNEIVLNTLKKRVANSIGLEGKRHFFLYNIRSIAHVLYRRYIDAKQ